MKRQRLGTVQNFTLTGTSQPSTAFSNETYMIRITATEGAYFVIGTTPVAADTDPLLGANVVDYITVTPGQKIAVLEADSGGVFSVTELV
jgi:hypothetical protein